MLKQWLIISHAQDKSVSLANQTHLIHFSETTSTAYTNTGTALDYHSPGAAGCDTANTKVGHQAKKQPKTTYLKDPAILGHNAHVNLDVLGWFLAITLEVTGDKSDVEIISGITCKKTTHISTI